jgi:hypothetical protein
MRKIQLLGDWWHKTKGENKEQREIDPSPSLKIGTQIALWVKISIVLKILQISHD